MDGVYSAWATRDPEGFTDDQIATLKRQRANRRRKRTKNRRRAIGTFTIATANMSSPLCSIGRQTLQVGVMSGIPAPLSSVAGQSLCPLTTGGNNDFYSEFAARP
jgi:hypothetical protein